jgi:hypothetical protein
MFVNNLWSVSESVVNKFTDGFIGGKCTLKKIIRFIPSVIFSVQFSKKPTGEMYVMSSVKLHIIDRTHPSLIPLVC